MTHFPSPPLKPSLSELENWDQDYKETNQNVIKGDRNRNSGNISGTSRNEVHQTVTVITCANGSASDMMSEIPKVILLKPYMYLQFGLIDMQQEHAELLILMTP